MALGPKRRVDLVAKLVPSFGLGMPKHLTKLSRYGSERPRSARLHEDPTPEVRSFAPGQIVLSGMETLVASAGETPTSVSTVALQNGLRRYGIEGEEAFLVLASHYLDVRKVRQPKLRYFPVERGQTALGLVAHDKQVIFVLDRIVGADPCGRELPTWYQYFVGRRFREGSGKFFTPRTIAEAMARLLPVVPGAVVMDPTCGAGTFLSETSRRWQDTPCTLLGNDVDRMLAGLTELVLALSVPAQHSFRVLCFNIYDAATDFEKLKAGVNCILANPPFSLALDRVGARSELFSLGYRNSDAVFLDVCLELLIPGGTLVCLVPHSLVANAEFQDLRKTVERSWELCGVVTLPEGVFYLTGNTTTRADIVHLRKRGARQAHPHRAFFANAPSVGFPLNSRSTFFGENSLNSIITDSRVLDCARVRRGE